MSHSPNVEPQTSEHVDSNDLEMFPLFAGNAVPQINNADSHFPDQPPPSCIFRFEPSRSENENDPVEEMSAENFSLNSPASPFAENAVPQSEENASPHSASNVEPLKPEIEVPHSAQTSAHKDQNNAVTHQAAEEAVSLETDRAARRKKRSSKAKTKKPRSTKRAVIPIKFFVTPAEKSQLETEAAKRGGSFSNYVRLSLGLTLNEAGRRKSHVVAAFDLTELDEPAEPNLM